MRRRLKVVIEELTLGKQASQERPAYALTAGGEGWPLPGFTTAPSLKEEQARKLIGKDAVLWRIERTIHARVAE